MSCKEGQEPGKAPRKGKIWGKSGENLDDWLVVSSLLVLKKGYPSIGKPSINGILMGLHGKFMGFYSDSMGY